MSGDNPEPSARRLDYRSAGVDIDEADRALDRIRPLVAGTRRPEVLSDVGSFGGLFRLNTAGFRCPVLVASTDGVGTKLRVARDAGRHEVPGYDLVSHCINDILVQGAEPLFFLDYLAMGRLDAEVAEDVIRGIANACREFGVALLGGETAEMPGFYQGGDYDLAGTIVGVVEEEYIIDGSAVVPGDVLIGLPSTGLHTNGYSLARTIVFDRLGLGIDDVLPGLDIPVADALLAPHRCYLPPIRPLLRKPEPARPRAHHRWRHQRQSASGPPSGHLRRGEPRFVPASSPLPAAGRRRPDRRGGDAPDFQLWGRSDRGGSGLRRADRP